MKEKKAVLKEKLENGETAIVLPVTALKCVEPTTDEVPELAEDDLVPIVQASDSAHLKAIKASALLKDVSDTINAAKKAVETAVTEAKQAAEKAQKAASEAESSCEKKPFTISAESWSQLGAPRGGYQYSAEITDETVTATDSASVDFGIDCYDVAVKAEIAGAVETAEGKITVFAKNTPESALSGVYAVEKEVKT